MLSTQNIPSNKTALRRETLIDVAEFLKSGGSIQTCKPQKVKKTGLTAKGTQPRVYKK